MLLHRLFFGMGLVRSVCAAIVVVVGSASSVAQSIPPPKVINNSDTYMINENF